MEFEFLADHPDAVPLVARWYFDQWGHRMAGNSYEKTCERIRGKLNRLRPPLHVVAVEAGAILAVAQIKLREMDIYPDKEHWLGGVFVSPDFRGKGIATE